MNKSMMIDFAILCLRVGLGVIFTAHGMQKLFGAFGGSGVSGFADSLKGMGFTPALFWAWVAALAEGLGGLFLLLGITPRISAGLIAIIMLVAIVKVHGPKGFFSMQGGCEYQFLILMTSVAIIIAGAGRFSVWNKF